MNAIASVVPFHGSNLITAKVNETEYVVMRPVVEGMGLDWKTQAKKIQSNHGCGHITTPLKTNSGVQEMLCIPLKKLNGWLFSINPAKVKESIRDKVIQYQDECFQVLHDYWHYGVVINKNSPNVHLAIKKAIEEKANKHRKAYPILHRKLWDHFQVLSYKEIPAERAEEAIQVIKDTVLEGEWLGPDEGKESNIYHFPKSYLLEQRKLCKLPGNMWLGNDELLNNEFNSPIKELLDSLESQGNDVTACRLEYMAYRDNLKRSDHNLKVLYNAVQPLAGLIKDGLDRGLPVHLFNGVRHGSN